MQNRFTSHAVMACLLCAALLACNSGRRGSRSGGGGGDDGRTVTGTGGLTNGDVCDQITPAGCDYQIRCGYWEGTESDCVATLRYDCCSGESCDWPAAGDATQVTACESGLRGLSCESAEVPAACEDLFGSEPDGGGEGTITLDAGMSGLYQWCSYDGDCPSEAEGCFRAYGADDAAAFFCTRRCDGDSDTTTCGSGAHCVSQPYDNPAVCMKACSGDTDCPRELRCRTLASGRQACAP